MKIISIVQDDVLPGQRHAGGDHHHRHVHDPRLHPPLLRQERVVRHPPLQPHGQHTASLYRTLDVYRRDISLLTLIAGWCHFNTLLSRVGIRQFYHVLSYLSFISGKPVL